MRITLWEVMDMRNMRASVHEPMRGPGSDQRLAAPASAFRLQLSKVSFVLRVWVYGLWCGFLVPGLKFRI